MVCSMVAALVQARFATPGLSRFVRAVLDLSDLDRHCDLPPLGALVLTGHCSKLQHTVATCLLFVHWALTGHCSKLQHTVATCLLFAY